jgi:hypothetical protein
VSGAHPNITGGFNLPKSTLGRAPSGHFARGNTLALKSGTRSEQIVKARSVEVTEELTRLIQEHATHLIPADGAMIRLAVAALTKLMLLDEYLVATSGGSLVDRRGVVRNSASLYVDLLRQCMSCLRELGLTPRGRAAMMDELGLAQNRKQVLVNEAQRRLRARVEEPSDAS